MLALSYGEALLRSGNYTGAYKQLYLLQKEYPQEHTGIIAGYLLTLLEAQQRDPYLADTEFRTLESSITPLHPLAPYFLLSRIETALATNQYDRAFQLLNQEDIAFPGITQKLRELRLGDYYSATNQLVKSYVTYQLIHDTPLLKSHPYSLNGYCDTLYRQKKYNQATECYRELAPQVSLSSTLGLITFRANMAELHFAPETELMNSFARIEDAFPHSEAASRAAIKNVDLKYMTNGGWSRQAANQYSQLAEASTLRPTAAEAAFKEALTYSLLGDQKKSIELLLVFLRDFQIAELRDTAYALLIDILPGEMKQLIKDGKFMDALVLAKKNRELFQNNWLDVSLLSDIGNAYQRVGIFSESQRVYLYLLEIADVETREQFFLPIIQSAFNQGEYGLVEDFASQYSYNYPEGFDVEIIRNTRIRALIATGNYTSARELLPNPLPSSREIRLLAGDIYFHDEDYTAVIDTLTPLDSGDTDLPIDGKFIFAESRFQNGDHFGAEAIFPTLVDNDQFGQQALYRMAQIERSRGNEENALKFLERIVEKDKESLWKRYAEKELQYSQLTKSVNALIDG